MPRKKKSIFFNDKYLIPLLGLLALLEPTCLGEIFLIIYLLPKAVRFKSRRRGRRR